MITTIGFLKKFDFKAMSLGYAFFIGTNHAFDYVLYPYVIYQRGPLWGGIVMMLLSAAACLADVLIYDLIKKDWLGIEAIKEMKEEVKNYESHLGNKLHKALAWFLKRGYWAEFVFLSLKFDPFVTTVYLRNGIKKFSGFKKEEWKIFIGSVIVSNAYWTMLSFSGVEVFLRILERV